MEWYQTALLVAACVIAFVLVAAFVAAVVITLIITRLRHPKVRPSHADMRQANINMGGVDFDAYDQYEKEFFTIHASGPKGHRGRGADIACEFLPVQNPGPGPAKCLIRAHGFGVNKITSVRYVQILRELGYSAVIYDQRSFGGSTGICSLGYYERQDLAAIVAWVRARLGEDTIIGLHGESLGAITILEALELVPGIAFAIPDSCSTTVFSTFKAVTRLPAFPFLSGINLWARLRHGADLRDVRPIDRVANSDVPILFIHGTKDWPMPYTESEKLYAAAKNPLSRLELFEGVWHTGAHMMEPERYVNAVHDFVKSAEARAAEEEWRSTRCSANTK